MSDHHDTCPCIAPAVREAMRRHEWPPITKRETEVLDHIARGESYEQISESLGVTPDTVKSHMRRIFRKLRAKNGPHAVSIAIGLQIIQPVEAS